MLSLRPPNRQARYYPLEPLRLPGIAPGRVLTPLRAGCCNTPGLGLGLGLSPISGPEGFNPDNWDFIKIGTRGPESDPGQFCQCSAGSGFNDTVTPKNVTCANNSTEYRYTPANPLTSGTIEFVAAQVQYIPVGGNQAGGNATVFIQAKLGGGAFATIVSAVTPIPASGSNPITVDCTVVSLDVAATGPWDAFKMGFTSPGFSFVQHFESVSISMLANE